MHGHDVCKTVLMPLYRFDIRVTTADKYLIIHGAFFLPSDASYTTS